MSVKGQSEDGKSYTDDILDRAMKLIRVADEEAKPAGRPAHQLPKARTRTGGGSHGREERPPCTDTHTARAGVHTAGAHTGTGMGGRLVDHIRGAPDEETKR